MIKFPIMKSEKLLFEKNIFTYNFISFFSELYFFVPIIVLFWQSKGLSMTQIYFLESLFALFVMVLEIPSGAFADRFGEKKAMLIGAACVGLASIFYGISNNFYHFLFSELVWGIGISFMSGADSTFLFNSLKALGRDDEYNHIEGNSYGFKLAGAGTGAFLGGFLASISLPIPFFVTGLSSVILFLIILRTIEPRHYSKVKTSNYKIILFESFKFIKKQKLVRWYLIFFGIMSSYNLIFWLYQPYLSMLGLPIQFFGIIFLLLNYTASFFSSKAKKIDSFFSKDGDIYLWILFSLILLIPFFILPYFVSFIGLVFLFFHQILRGAFKPLIKKRILEHTYENKRATILSCASFSERLNKMLLGPIVGIIVDSKGLLNGIKYIGLFFVPVIITILILYKKIPKRYFKLEN
jgi:MFS family permease